MKEDNTTLYQAIGNSIQENKNKIEKLEKQNERLRRENKKLVQLETNWKELKKWLENSWEQSHDIWYVKVINKMEEMEKQNENNK